VISTINPCRKFKENRWGYREERGRDVTVPLLRRLPGGKLLGAGKA
jgi:hypothetical protein